MRRPTIRECTFAAAGAAAVVTASASAVTLFRLAEHCAIESPFAAALPVAVDLGATVGALAWIGEPVGSSARRWGRGIAVAALVATVVGNGIEHSIAAGLVRPTLPLVLAVGAAIPASLWAIVHLAAVMSRPARRPAGRKLGGDRPARTTTPTTPRPPDALAVRRQRHDRQAMAEWLASRPEQRPGVEHTALIEQFGCGLTTAKEVRAAVRGTA